MNSGSRPEVVLDGSRLEQVFQLSNLLGDLISFEFADVRASSEEIGVLVDVLRDVRNRLGRGSGQVRIFVASDEARPSSDWRSDSEVWIRLNGEIAGDWYKLLEATAGGMDDRELLLRTGYTYAELSTAVESLQKLTSGPDGSA